MIYVSFFVGLLLICKGGDWFVDAASAIARALGIPKYIVGATIVSFATTMPEILVSVAAALKGSAVMAIGNAVGSVSANTGIILGVSLFCLPSVIDRREYLTKNILYLGCLLLLFISFRDRSFDAGDCLFLLGGGILFLLMNVKNAMTGRTERERLPGGKRALPGRLCFFALGAACVVVGSELLIDSACALARQFQISEEIISVTILAMGTSLPEFVTTITAILKKNPPCRWAISWELTLLTRHLSFHLYAAYRAASVCGAADGRNRYAYLYPSVRNGPDTDAGCGGEADGWTERQCLPSIWFIFSSLQKEYGADSPGVTENKFIDKTGKVMEKMTTICYNASVNRYIYRFVRETIKCILSDDRRRRHTPQKKTGGIESWN